jgi:membrane peptidoglycan carboxypeptidase
VAGKTGTTSSNKDRWFCGYTGYYTAAVWCGYDQPEVIRITSGEGNPSAVLFRKVLKPLHEGKSKISLWSKSGMRSYSVCLDSGKSATAACGKDLRAFTHGLGRTSSAYAFSGPGGSCTKHVLVDYCVTGNGVATSWCRKFASETDQKVEISERALVKLTPSEVQELKQAYKVGLYGDFVDDHYVYYVSEGGSDQNWHGFSGNANPDVDAPYVICPKHNQKTWDEYQESIATEPPTEPPTEAPADPPADAPAE